MKLIAVQGIKGGVGATTLTANLAAELHREQIPLLVLDMCRSNLLRLHFAMPWADTDGWARRLADKKPWYDASYRSAEGITFVPFGRSEVAPSNDVLLNFMTGNGGLKAELAAVDLPEDCWVLVDCPSGPHGISEAISEIADEHLLVVNAEPSSFALMHDWHIRDNTRFVINRFNPLTQIERDLGDVMQYHYQHSLVPVSVHNDESVREALACRQVVVSAAPHSQAAQDMVTLATWLRAKGNHEAAA